jgi:DNA-binding protein HU-beta
MNKSELIQYVADEADLPRAAAGRIINMLFDPAKGVIAQTMKKGDQVSITGFGTFVQKQRGARTGRNPQTGATLKQTVSGARKAAAK